MLAAEAQFRRVKGHKELPALLAALATATAGEPDLLDCTSSGIAADADAVTAAA